MSRDPPPNPTFEPLEGAAWRAALPLLALTIAAIVALYWSTAQSIVAIWYRSETFAHGFIVVPIVLYLIWTRRRSIAAEMPKPDWLGVVCMAVAGVAWLVAAAGKVQVVQQYALVAMIISAVIALVGRKAAWAMAFPLGFLFLGVPIGENLMLPLMNFTADFAVAALKLTGIPVYREGTFFAIPSGQWSVVEACSGLRYLIASLTVGCLYAYLTYTKLWKRIAFIALSLAAPVLANGIRAYLIVLIAHLSDMKLATGIDHVIYGWVFFGAVMLLIFWIGSFWRDADPDVTTEVSGAGARAGGGSTLASGRIAAGIAAMVVAAVPLIYVAWLDRPQGDPRHVLATPRPVGGWELDPSPATAWRPRYLEPAVGVVQTYRKGDRSVLLYLAHYPRQKPGSELVTSVNVMVVQEHPVWSQVGERVRTEQLMGGTVDVRQTLLRSPGQRLLIWDWLRIGERDTSNRYQAKLLLARNKLLGQADAGSALIVATAYEAHTDPAEKTLREFISDMRLSIDESLRQVATASEGDGSLAKTGSR